MSDDKLHQDTHEDHETDHREPENSSGSGKNNMPPAVALAFVIIALLGVLIVMVLRNGSLASSFGSSDVSSLQSEVDARRADLNRQRIALGLSPLEGSAEPIGDIANRLKKDADALVSLASRFQEMLAEKDTELSARSAELLNSERLRKSLFDENSRLQGQLNQALVSGSDADRLRADLASLRSQRDALAAELDAAREKLKSASGISSEDYADLQRRLDEAMRAKEFFESRVKELEGDLSNARLFARSEDELLPAAVELFRELRLLENKPDSDLTSAYSRFGIDLGASVLQTVTFATGSYDLTTENQQLIRQLVEQLPDGDLLFVVGYASRTGNPESNQTLSSNRATAVAEFYSQNKRPEQLAQAVYLGQTARFSSRVPERNQLCEIWRIRRKQ
ncbi:MAG: OmpA family protein [Verrucomicrobiota bacterium]